MSSSPPSPVWLLSLVAAPLAVSLLGGLSVVEASSQPTWGQFQQWQLDHGRAYSGKEEEAHRFDLFIANHLAMETNAHGAPLAHYEPDEFFDWSPAEFRQRSITISDTSNHSWPWAGAEPQQLFSDLSIAQAGPIDWVAKGAVTPAISQGRCATCAQFSATENVEAQWFLAGHPLQPLAVQEMIDCSSYTGPYGMGWVSDIHHGLDLATDYPLANHSDPNITGCRSPCDNTAANKTAATIDGATCLEGGTHNNETQMLAWLQHGPLSVSIASGPFNGYTGGIITGDTCNNTNVGHAVLLVGYGIDPDSGTKYWTLKNSWGPAFGEDGYVRIEAFYPGGCLSICGACQAYIGSPPSP